MINNNDFFQFNQIQNITNIRDYIIIKRIGFGSSGLVYQVYKNNDPNKTILILKQIPFRNVSIDLEETTRKLKEAKNESIILSNLSFKYVVKYYDSFIEDDCLNIIMEYCEKGDLGTYINSLIQKNYYLSEQQIWHFFIQISLGLAYIHSKKILHRDLKPMNIFMKKNNLIKIGDLGVAKILQTNTKAITYIGTPYYLSPEVCEGKPYNSKSDVWALGCILYELCTFKKPFNAFNQAALCLKIIEGKFIPINKIEGVPKYSKNLENMINCMLKRNYMERPLMREIINNKIFFEKAVILGYDADVKSIYNNYYNINIKNNNIIKNIKINNLINYNEQYSNRENQNDIKTSIPAKSRENKLRRINSSGIDINKKRRSIQNSININKISKNDSSKNSCKKYKPKYPMFFPKDKKKSKSMGKNTIETSHNYTRNSKIKEKNKNILITLDNYEDNKKKYIIPRQSSKKIMIRNKLINNLDEKPKLLKCNSNFNNISLINKKFSNNKEKNKSKSKENNKYSEVREIINYIHKNDKNNNFKKEFSYINKNRNNNDKSINNKNKKEIQNNKNMNNLNNKAFKIISIDKKYISINKTSINNSKSKTRKKIISNQYTSNSKKFIRDGRIIQKNILGNDHQSSDNLFKKHKNNIEINNINNNTNFDCTHIKLSKNTLNRKNIIEKYSSPYTVKDSYIDDNKINTEDNQIKTDNNNSIKKNININNNYFELNNNHKQEILIFNEKPKLDELFTITKNNTSDKTNNDLINENYYKSYFDSNTDINITKTEEDNEDNEEKVSILKEKNSIMKEKINQKKEEYLFKYNECKNNILNYKNIIDIKKLFSLYELISKDKEKAEDIIKEIENYLIANLPEEFYKQFHKLFNNFIFYDVEIENINRLEQKFS